MNLAALQSGPSLLTRWRRASRAFNARLLTERRLIIIAVVCVLWFLLDSMWVTPAYQRMNKVLTQKNTAQAEQLSLLSQQTQLSATLTAQQRQAVQELEQLRQRIAQGQQELAQMQAQLAPAREMPKLLEAVLAKHGQLRLRSMRTLAPTEVRSGGTTGALLYRHGLELVVEGGFHDLLNWLRSVEAMPQRLIWADMKLASDDASQLSLSLQVYTLSPDKDALEIAP